MCVGTALSCQDLNNLGEVREELGEVIDMEKEATYPGKGN